ncbi:MAG: helical backbone metal receptor [Gammaproteobacteria bacterium]
MLIDAIGQQHPRAGADARIVSLVPSITELLFELGLAGQVVGRTGFCIHPRAALREVPKLGGTKDVDLEGVRELAPTHVIVNIDENTRETYAALCSFVPHVIVTHPNAPDDNLELYTLLGGIFSCAARATELAQAYRVARRRVDEAAQALPARRVLYLIWRDPWMSVGPDTYIARTLALVGWHTVATAAADRYPSFSASELGTLAPDLCLLSSEPYPFRAKHVAEVERLCGARGRVYLIDGEMLSWYGSRAIAGLDYLARTAHTLLEEAA